jgi:glucokinase
MKEMAIGIDLGGTSLRIGVYVGHAGYPETLLESITLPTRVEAGPDAVVDDIAQGIHRLLHTHRLSLPLTGIGIGSPGPINLVTGTLGHLPNFPGWDGFALRPALEDALDTLDTPVLLECDANAAALAEWKAGAGRKIQVESMCMLTLGTGVGSGIILGGHIWHGMVGMGGEAGHTPLIPGGPLCGCGSRGCLEVYASATGLARAATELAAAGEADDIARLIDAQGAVTALDLALLARSGSASALHLYNRFGYYIGLGLAGLVSTLDLPLYVVGGGVASAWDLFSGQMFETLRESSYVYRLGEPTQRVTREVNRTFICPALIGPSAGLLGAAMLPSFRRSSSSSSLQSETTLVPTLERT